MKSYLLSLACLLFASSTLFAATTEVGAGDFGIVNFRKCVEKSKLGKQEQAAFEALKKQMVSSLEKTEKELSELSEKFSDSDYVDSLSPDSEMEMKKKLKEKNEQFAQDQNQYYQMLNQFNFRLIKETEESVAKAASRVAEQRDIKFVVNEETFFFFKPELDITEFVIDEMNKMYDAEQEQSAANSKESLTVPASEIGAAH